MSAFSLVGVVFICIVWGAGFPFMKIGLGYLPPFLYVGIRFSITALCVFLYMRLMRIEWRFGRKMFWWIVALTAFFYVQQGLIFLGLTYTKAGRMGVILNTQPIITAVAAHWFVEHDKLTWAKVAGLLLAIIGVFFVFRQSFTEFNRTMLFGDFLALIAAVSWGSQTIVTKHVVKHVAPSAIIFWQAAISCVLFFLTSACLDPGPIPKQAIDLTFVGVTAYVILVSTVFGFVGWVYLLRHNNPSAVTSFCFITPIASVVFAWLILGEPITSDIIVATGLVGLGIFIANFRSRQEPAPNVV
ncbi:MAG: DMT family transporter [Planctomycetes bacterium]|nr:DMT family transporter [Planctomycetota bacterium]